jgi:signal transduction histidine kinase
MRSRASRPGFWLAGRFSPRQVDWAVLGAATLLMLPSASISGVHDGWRGWAALAALPFSTVPLYWRRRYPGAVLAVLVVSFVAYALAGRSQSDAGLVFGIYAAALYGNRSVRIVVGALAVALCALVIAYFLSTSRQASPLGHIVPSAVVSAIAWLLGDRTRTRRAYLAALEERASRLEHERDENTRRATEEERSRIARELHDVVTHSVSVIAVQAGAGRRTAETNPGRSVEILETIERTARGALGELRALLGVLRRDSDEASLRRPQPTLGELATLVEEMRKAGLEVDIRVDGPVRPIDAVLDVCGYRIIQEALTNVIKHAPGASAHVSVLYGDDALSITVVDNGPGPNAVPGAGHGLIGMRERVELIGGRLSTGCNGRRGFRVQAVLPYSAPGTPVPATSSFRLTQSAEDRDSS